MTLAELESVLHDRRADTACWDWEREPGSDDE